MHILTLMSFQPGDIVWAKYDEFCFWPARIATEPIATALKNHKKDFDSICVLFFGHELLYSLVKPENVVDYKEFYQKNRNNSKDSDFSYAIKQANENKKFPDPPLELQIENICVKSEIVKNEPKTTFISEADDKILNKDVEESLNKDVDERKDELVDDVKKVKTAEDNKEIATENKISEEVKEEETGETVQLSNK